MRAPILGLFLALSVSLFFGIPCLTDAPALQFAGGALCIFIGALSGGALAVRVQGERSRLC
jgi:hypothetical protein